MRKKSVPWNQQTEVASIGNQNWSMNNKNISCISTLPKCTLPNEHFSKHIKSQNILSSMP